MVVADGVSGTKKASGVLARALVKQVLLAMKGLTNLAADMPMKASHFRRAVEIATERAIKAVESVGRLDSTLSVYFADKVGGHAYIYTLGDCKCVVFRDNKFVFESNSTVYDFNAPAVVSTKETVNSVQFADVQVTSFEKEDICLLFSDGVNDNLFTDDVVECIKSKRADGSTGIARALVKKAKDTVGKSGQYIPFSVSALKSCEEYVEELDASGSEGQIARILKARCAKMPSRTDREMFGLEKTVKYIQYYTIQQLFAFAAKDSGKEDDISACVAIF